MIKRIDAKSLGLLSRTVIEALLTGRLALVMDRKSRIIMADGKKIVAKAEKIKAYLPDYQVALKTTAPVCSKTKRLLKEHLIYVLPFP